MSLMFAGCVRMNISSKAIFIVNGTIVSSDVVKVCFFHRIMQEYYFYSFIIFMTIILSLFHSLLNENNYFEGSIHSLSHNKITLIAY